MKLHNIPHIAVGDRISHSKKCKCKYTLYRIEHMGGYPPVEVQSIEHLKAFDAEAGEMGITYEKV